jgi:hypothetical protein
VTKVKREQLQMSFCALDNWDSGVWYRPSPWECTSSKWKVSTGSAYDLAEALNLFVSE